MSSKRRAPGETFACHFDHGHYADTLWQFWLFIVIITDKSKYWNMRCMYIYMRWNQIKVFKARNIPRRGGGESTDLEKSGDLVGCYSCLTHSYIIHRQQNIVQLSLFKVKSLSWVTQIHILFTTQKTVSYFCFNCFNKVFQNCKKSCYRYRRDRGIILN